MIKGIKVPFNKKNVYGEEPCCCQKGMSTKFAASTLFCLWCNITCARKRKKTNSFCKKNNWDKTCRTCQNSGNYKVNIGRTDDARLKK